MAQFGHTRRVLIIIMGRHCMLSLEYVGKGKEEKAKGATGAPWPNVHVNWAGEFAYHSILLTELQIEFGTNISHKKAPKMVREGISELVNPLIDWRMLALLHIIRNTNGAIRIKVHGAFHSQNPILWSHQLLHNKYYYQPTTCHRMLVFERAYTNQHVTQPGHV